MREIGKEIPPISEIIDMAGFWLPRTGAILVNRSSFCAFDYNHVFKANLPLPIHTERTIPLHCIFRNYLEIDNVFATLD